MANGLLDWHYPEAILREADENRTTVGEKKKLFFLAGTIGGLSFIFSELLCPPQSLFLFNSDVELDPSADGTLRKAHALLMRVKLKSQLRPAVLDAFERRLRRIV